MAPNSWLKAVHKKLIETSATLHIEKVVSQIPSTNNADLTYQIKDIIVLAYGKMSWEALGWFIDGIADTYNQFQNENQVELLWTGPAPAGQVPARRIEQALYDLIHYAQQRIYLITFAASRIDRLANHLAKAADRGVLVKMVLEFEESSEGQLTYDAIKAFPKSVVDKLEIYNWPIDKRERNKTGRPGKLHAKVALIDNAALISSANLTDDAFNRNFEVGSRIQGGKLPEVLKEYIDGLIRERVLERVNLKTLKSDRL